MSQTILIKRGNLSNILSSNTLVEGELVLSLNTQELIAVTGSGNKSLVGRCIITTSTNMPGEHLQGRFIYQTDTEKLLLDDGSNYIVINEETAQTFDDLRYINCVISGSIDENTLFPNYLVYDSNHNVLTLTSPIRVNFYGYIYKIDSLPDLNCGALLEPLIFLLLKLDHGNFTLTYTTKKPIYSEVKPSNPSNNMYWYDLIYSQMKKWNGSSWIKTNEIEIGWYDHNNHLVSLYAYKLTSTTILYVTRRRVYNFNPHLPCLPTNIMIYQTDKLKNPWAMLDGDYYRYSSIIQSFEYNNVLLATPRRYSFDVYTASNGERSPNRANSAYYKIIMQCSL